MLHRLRLNSAPSAPELCTVCAVQVAMQALANVHPVTHAIGNTMRRVVIMVVSMVVFRTPMTPLGAAGSAMAIIGAFAYAMARRAT